MSNSAIAALARSKAADAARARQMAADEQLARSMAGNQEMSREELDMQLARQLQMEENNGRRVVPPAGGRSNANCSVS